MKRRKFVLAAISLVAAGVAGARERTKPPRVGFLAIGPGSGSDPFLEAFREGLAAHGFRDGGTVVIDARWPDGSAASFAKLANVLVHELKVDVLVIGACGNPWMEAVRRASRSIPLIVASCGGIAGFLGEVESLARPGGNTTGQTTFAPELASKRLQLLKELLPGLSAAAVLWNPDSRGWDPYWKALRTAATDLGVALHSIELREPAEIEAAFGEIRRHRAGALLTLVDGLIWNLRGRIIESAGRSRLPAVYDVARFADLGGLLAYSVDIAAGFRNAGGQVAKVLNGTNPGEIPIEQISTVRLVVNLKTANAMGLAIPPSMLLRADRVIE